ncbi:hypothetical protein MCOR25_007884 [Pyricularia grisea]|uniref:Pleckstrin homology domain-containing protein n=1 Tax=Pyricularia grisea TaxID=148305 RepID=A0A6P8B2A9_PYRGI|nr:uncharacterized protein PgNI_07703 [Pyricularia grisea]KAI6356712.1 hypothetical protein MCOR25_007884 [Pyricularia grisea]TLD09035.1 hypothetical protein PgNI_07703 [Pyricularia grisea]
MAVWETEDESSHVATAAAASLPTPADTPYRTPSRGSRKSRRSMTPPGKNGIPPLPTEKPDRNSKRSSVDYANDENISVLDPRRFTPNLHANLVSEILNLRRDQEDKTKIIESLESTLHAEREEQQSLQETLTNTSKENRSIKRQLALLEGGTSSALGELARERDEAIEAIAEVRKRLETTQKRLRQQEDDSQRVHDQFEKERLEWDEDRRKYERKVHVAESRLKSLLEEVAAFQAAQAQGLEADAEEPGREANDAASIRTMSMTNSIRFSTFSTPGKPIGHSLADELNFDGESDYDTDAGRGRDSALSNHMHMRNNSKDSVLSRMHRRNISNDSLIRPGSAHRTKFLNQSVLDRLEDGVIEEDEEDTTMIVSDTPPKPAYTYVDAAVQYSPPPSPVVQPVKPVTPEPPTVPSRASKILESHESSPRADGEVEANQRRKRVHIARPMTIEAVVRQTAPMVSTSSQTTEAWSQRKSVEPEKVVPSKPAMVSTSTQTEGPAPASPGAAASDKDLMQIPSISIHPPTSRPSTPREPRLPQLTKDFGCQVAIITSSVSTRSVSVQTEKIQMDQRLKKLPAHLHPSAITSRPVSPVPAGTVDGQTSNPAPGNLPPRNPMRLATQKSLSNLTHSNNKSPTSPTMPTMPVSPTIQVQESEETTDAYPGNNDDGPLSSQKAPIRRPHRISSLFAGFDGGSSDEADEFAGADVSDSEFRTALTAPGGARPPSVTGNEHTRRASGGAKRALESPVSIKQSGTRGHNRSGAVPASPTTETYSKYAIPDGRESGESAVGSWRSSMQSVGSSRSQGDKLGALSSNRASVMRKAVMIQNGIATHQGRSRSPSLPDAMNPPFPIPTRASSRRPPFSASAPSDGQRSPTRRHSKQRPSSIRKTKSAAALPPRQKRNGSRSPPTFSAAEEEDEEDPLESPGLPPLPNNDITTPRTNSRFSRSHHRQQPSTSTAVTNATTGAASTGGNSTQAATGVVDAIAQTMVGEWMFKYVRRRRSFGVQGSGEASGRDDTSNDRHKRWVWLAPYERAILWSSKQPVSGSALLGKAGRKLVIQSVLDVKDDNPTPKGATSVFDRSILILTPQRALKFTATTRERHYVWLTALSFLAHSNQEVPEILASPPSTTLAVNKAPLSDYDLAQQKPQRRGGIRDSIRLAKGRTIVTRGGGGGGGLMSIASSTQTDFNTASIPSTSNRPPESIMSSISAGTAGTSYGPAGFVSTMSSNHQRETSRDTAAPPPIPRFNDSRMSMLSERANQVMVHGRKRSNTGGHVPPPLSFRGFSGPASNGRDSANSGSYHQSTNSTAGASVETSGSSGILGSFGGSNWNGAGGNSSSAGQASQRTSEASSRPSAAPSNNFFDAIGTVRMEAFISPLAQNSIGAIGGYPDEEDEMRYRARRRSKEMRRRASRSRQRDNYGNRIPGAASRAGSRYEEDFFSRDDPFKGF